VSERDVTLLRRLARLGDLLVGAYIVIEQLVLPVIRPAARVLALLPPFVWIEQGAAKLPPYAALFALAVPFAIAEPAKVFGLYLIGEEQVWLGVLVIVSAYLVSLLIVDRIYEGARFNLLTIGWFAKLMSWLIGAREAMLERLRNAAAGRWLRAKVKSMFGTAS